MKNKKTASIRNKLIETMKFSGKMVGNVMDHYFLNQFQKEYIHNDLGASFTNLERRGNHIVKRAQERGEDKLIDEIKWYLLFKNTKFEKYIPRIEKYSLEKGSVFYEMKYYNFPNLRKIILEDMNAFFFLKKRWRYLFEIILTNLFIEKNSAPSYDKYPEKVHFSKYDSRMADAKKDAPKLLGVFTAEALTINCSRYLSSDVIIARMRREPEIQQNLTPPKLYLSHGDIHCNNILCGIGADHLILLDCRGKSPDGSLYFDPAYDIAKINHDIRSMYSLIEKHLFSIFLHEKGKEPSISYEFTNPRQAAKFYGHYEFVHELVQQNMTEFGDIEYRADFIESLLYLTMVPLHLKSEAEGLMCYITGVLRLNEWLEKYHPKINAELRKNYLKENS